MKKSFKIFLFLIVIALCLWTYLWFYTANIIEKSLSNIHYDNYNIDFDNIAVKGFPFKMAFTINNTKVKYNNINISFDKITLTTNLSLNKLSIALPSKTNANFVFHDTLHNILIDSNKDFFLEFKDYGSFNTLRVLNAIKNNSSFFKEFYITKLHFHAGELLIKNAINDKEIAKEYIDCKILFDKKTDIITGTDLNINFIETTLNSDAHFLHNLDKIEINGSVYFLTKKQDQISLIDFATFNPLNIKLNETLFSVKGDVEQDKTNNTSLKLHVSADNWLDLLNTSLNQKLISEDRYNLIITVIKEITGLKSTDLPLNIKIFNEPNKGIRVGNSSAYRLMLYFEKFIATP